MSEKKPESVDFSALFKDAKPVKHDKYVPTSQTRQLISSNEKLLKAKKRANDAQRSLLQQGASVALSDQFEAHWPVNKAIKYLRNDIEQLQGEEHYFLHKDLLKKLAMAQIPPDLELDLHGLNAKNAKADIIAAIFEAKKNHYTCINIIHGHGSGILKQKVPNWLVQHPDVAGFIQAPRVYGGKAGLLVLVTLDVDSFKF